MKSIIFIILSFMMYATSVASPLACKNNIGNDIFVEIETLSEIKSNTALAKFLDEKHNYIAPAVTSCEINKTSGTNVSLSLKLDKGEVQDAGHNSTFSFISFGSYNQAGETPVRDQRVFVYTKSLSENAYQQLADVTLSQREAVSRFFMVRYTHLFKKAEPQSIVVIWNEAIGQQADEKMNVLSFKYIHPLYQ